MGDVDCCFASWLVWRFGEEEEEEVVVMVGEELVGGLWRWRFGEVEEEEGVMVVVENGSGGVTGPRRRREAAYCGSMGSAVGAGGVWGVVSQWFREVMGGFWRRGKGGGLFHTCVVR